MSRRSSLLSSLVVVVGASVASAQTADLAEGNAGSWGTFASDNAAASVATSTAKIKDGASSVLFTTQSGFDTGVRYPATLTLNLNASAYNTLVFWMYPENSTPIGWQGNQPIVTIKTGGGAGTIRLEPTSQLTPNFAWRLVKVPLAGGAGWLRTTTGTPNLADVDQIEIKHDTWDAGFRIWYDGVRFMNLDPNTLPPAGPTPPAGVDPDIIESKVYLYIFDPIMENLGGQRLHAAYGWADPVTLTNQAIADLYSSSYGRARLQIVETVIADEHPRFADGFQHTDASFVTAWAAHDFHSGTFDYVGFCNSHNLGVRVDAGEIDEVWIYSPPIGGMWESCMAGQGAYWINGGTYPAAGRTRVFPIMGLNYERGVGEAIHSFGHRSENVMVHSYGSWQANRNHMWNRFSLLDRDAPGLGGVGNVHFPVNGESDYDYANARFVDSNADAWLNYPNLNDTTRSINFRTWSRQSADPQREYLKWWYGHMPHVPGRAPDFYLSNWWRYLLDLDQFKNWNGRLDYTIGIPSVQTTLPAQGAVVQGLVAVKAAAEVDGALGRVDLYVDGQYVDSDYLAPYTFVWDASAAAGGTHTIVTKAYELQNGTEGVAPPISVSIRCQGDFNGVGGVTVQDIFDFLAAYFAGSPAADVNGVGGVTVQDIFDFLGAYFTVCA
jgi:hypothetical protein